MRLDMPIQYIKDCGPKRAKLFNKLKVFTVQDLLEYYPKEWVFPMENFEERLIEIRKWKQKRLKGG